MLKLLTAEERFKKYNKLIEWAARRYTTKIPLNYPGVEEFSGEGREVLARCHLNWGGRGNEEAFGKFFKASLFHKFQDMLVKAYSKKRGTYTTPVSPEKTAQMVVAGIIPVEPEEFSYYQEEPIEEAYKNFKNRPGEKNPLITDEFRDVLFKELVDHVKSKIETSLEKKIFTILVDPPEDLCKMAVAQNRRKMKLSMSRHCKGVNIVKLSSKLIIAYLNSEGTHIDENAYYVSKRNIKRIVMETIKEG